MPACSRISRCSTKASSGSEVRFAFDLGLQALDDGGIEHWRRWTGLAAQNFGRLADDAPDLAVRHRTEAERHLIDAGEFRRALHQHRKRPSGW